MSEILTDFSPGVLAEVINNSHTDFFTHLCRAPRGEIDQEPELVRVLTGLPHPLFNGVFRAQLASDGINGRINAALAPFKEQGLPMFWWHGPLTRPAALGARLEARGLSSLGAMPGMAANLHAFDAAVSTPDGFSIETVADHETLRQWGQVTNRSFGMPEAVNAGWLNLARGAGLDLPLRYYLGRWNGAPVAASLLFLTRGVASVMAVATAKDARRQGTGAVITLAPLQAAREMGYRIGVLSASPMGLSVYQRLGFQGVCKLGLYQWPPVTPPQGPAGSGGAA